MPRSLRRQHRRPACICVRALQRTECCSLELPCFRCSWCACTDQRVRACGKPLTMLRQRRASWPQSQNPASPPVYRHLQLCWRVSAGCASAGTARTARQASVRVRCARSRGGQASMCSSAGCPAAATSTTAAACRTSSRTSPAGSCGTRPRCASSSRASGTAASSDAAGCCIQKREGASMTLHADRPAGSHRSPSFVVLEAASSGRCLAVGRW
jgi:hypothetical protein